MAIDHNSYTIQPLFSAEAIAQRVGELAAEISQHYADTERLIVASLLRGASMFTADLVRRLELPLEVDFLQAASYGDAMESSGTVQIVKDLSSDPKGLDLLLVEDIVDTGRTLAKVTELLQARAPRRLETCALLDKPSRRKVEVAVKWVGFTIPDDFVVGYGIDYAQRHRNLPYIGKVVMPDKT